MPSKLFGQYQQEQVQQINYLPYTGKISEMLATAGGNLAEGIVEGIKTYQANNELADFNKIQSTNLAPILASMRGELAKSKELSAYLPEVDAQIKTLTDSSGKAPKVAAAAIQGVGAYINGFNARFQTQQNLVNTNLASDIGNNFSTSVSGARPATVDSSAVDYNGDLSHWQNISKWNEYLDMVESEGKSKGVTIDRKQATVQWLKGKLDFIQNQDIPNLSPEKKDKLVEILSSEIESMNLGEFADGTPYDPSKTVDSTFTINDANGNPVTISVPAKETAPTASIGTPPASATPVSTGTIIPTGIPSGSITRESVGAPSPILVNPLAPAKVTPPAKKTELVTTVPFKSNDGWASDPKTPPTYNPRNIIEPISETAPSSAQTPKTEDDLLFEELADVKTGAPIPSSHWEQPAQDTIEVPASGQLTPEQLKKYKYDNYENIDEKGKVSYEVLNYNSEELPSGNFKIKVNRKPTDQEIIERKQEEIGLGKAGRFMKPPSNEAPAKVEGQPVSTLAPAKVDVNPMRSSKMAMAVPMGITAPTKVAPIKTTTPTGRARTPEAIDAEKVKNANLGIQEDHLKVAGRARMARNWAQVFKDDMNANPDNPKSIDFNMYGGWSMKNPNSADAAAVVTGVASWILPTKWIGATLSTFKAEGVLAKLVPTVAEKIMAKAAKAGKVITEEQAIAEAVGTAGNLQKKMKLVAAGKVGLSASLLTAGEAVMMEDFASSTSEWAMPDFNKIYSGSEGKEELKQKSEKLIDDIREVRQGGFQMGFDNWGDLTNGQKQVKLFAIEKLINQYQQETTQIENTSMAERRKLIDKPLTKGDIMNGKLLSDGVSKTQAVVKATPVNRKVNIHSTGKQDIIAGTQEYTEQLSLDEQKDRMKKFVIQKYGYVPSGFDQMFKTLHPETDFQTMSVGNTQFYRDATKGWTPLPQPTAVQQKSLKQQAEDSAFLFGTPNAKGDFVPREFVEGSGVYLRGLFRGTEKQLNEFYDKYDGLIKARKIVNRLTEINDMFGESMPWNQEVKGEVAGLLSDLKASYRTEIVGVGTVSNYEQELIAEVIADPTTFWSWESKDKAKLLTILNRTNDRIKTLPSIHGLEVRQISSNGKDVEASLRANYTRGQGKSERQLNWEAKNPALSSLDKDGKKKQIVIPE